MRLLGRTTLALTLAFAVLTPAYAATAQAADQQPLLAKRAHGQAALTSLGHRVDDAAAVNGLDAREFAAAVREDPALWVGRDGRLFYADSAEHAEEAAEASAPEVQAAAAALEDTFTLHSLPGSNHTIYLDFGSVTLASNSWWVQNGGMSAQTFSGYSSDGDPAFNDTEKTFVQQVWSIVAEKYAAFDVDVTTENPGTNGYNRTSAGDPTWGTRVAITSDDAALAQACGGCAGVALIDVFDAVDSGQYEPAWVFTDLVGTATLTANAAAHEVGHTLGLDHDGTTSSSYYSGHNHWVPIMGITNSKAVAQFSKGEYAGADNTENDLAIIAASGAPLRTPDDAGNTTGTATALPPATSYEVQGVITSATDKDVYAVTRDCVQDFTATATGIGTGQTLDIKVSVYDSAGALIGADDEASSNVGAAATGMNAEYAIPDAAGTTYFVEVDGVGSGGLGNVPNPSTGYTDYASIGQYTLAITGCPAGTNPPAAPQSLTASPTLRSTNGSVQWTAGSAGSSPITGYTVSGLPGGTVTVGAGTTSVASTSLVPGTTYPVSVVATNAYGDSPAAEVNLKVPTWVPSAAPTLTPAVVGKDASATWTTVANPGGSTITGWSVVLKKGLTTVSSTTVPAADPRSVSYPALAPGSYTLRVTVVATAEDLTGTTAGTANFSVAGDKPSAPQNLTGLTTPRSRTITLDWDAPASLGDDPDTEYFITGFDPAATYTTASTGLTMPNLVPGQTYNVRVIAGNQYGTGPGATTSVRIDTWLPTSAPSVSRSVSGNDVTVTWGSLTNVGGATLTGWNVVLTKGGTTVRSTTVPITSPKSISYPNLAAGSYTVSVTIAGTADITAGTTPGTATFSAAGKPSAPKIGTASSGTSGGTVTAVARWGVPTSTGGSAITGYKVVAYRLSSTGAVVRTYFSPRLSSAARSRTWTTLPSGRYKFRVVAYNAVGTSPYSPYSATVTAR